jgi:hypothetical protein
LFTSSALSKLHASRTHGGDVWRRRLQASVNDICPLGGCQTAPDRSSGGQRSVMRQVPLRLCSCCLWGDAYRPSCKVGGELSADWRRLGMAHQQALAKEGVRQPGDSLPGSALALVPAGPLPTAQELEQVSVDRGPAAFRPRPTKRGGHDSSHLCELVACRLPRERFWEAGEALSGNRSRGPLV